MFDNNVYVDRTYEAVYNRKDYNNINIKKKKHVTYDIYDVFLATHHKYMVRIDL